MTTKKDEFSQEEVFDRMAPGWYNRRHWTIFRHELEELAGRWQKGRLLNIGCGHGADFLPFCQGFELNGLDFSSEMLRFAGKYAKKFKFEANLIHGDAAKLPFKSAAIDWVISVAAYHHLSDFESRQGAFYELNRVLKPGGEAFVTVWNHWQPEFWLKPREVRVKWRTKETELYRYYYLFSRRELEAFARRAGFRILRSYAETSYHFPVKQFSKNVCLLLGKSFDKKVV
jgi:tRNA (uracil-5-)-methyltransferase TRM9